MKEFKFYTPLPNSDELHFWMDCADSLKFFTKENLTCNEGFIHLSTFGFYILKNDKNRMNPAGESTKNLSLLPRNESQQVFEQLVKGTKIAIAGSNTEIDEVLLDLKNDYKGTTLFRSIENLWPHNKHWMFSKISYSQSHFELTQLMASGIYNYWKYWLRDRTYLEAKLRKDDSPVPLSLRSNVFFVFVILIIGLSATTFTFVLETLIHKFKKYHVRVRLKLFCRGSFNTLVVNISQQMRVIYAAFMYQRRKHWEKLFKP